jgi:uncharacterized protein YjiS (DUF1127 family)
MSTPTFHSKRSLARAVSIGPAARQATPTQTLFRMVAELAAALGRTRRRRDMRKLDAMDDRLLCDIGVSRAQSEWALRYGLTDGDWQRASYAVTSHEGGSKRLAEIMPTAPLS